MLTSLLVNVNSICINSGRYHENHGIVGNKMLDMESKEEFSKKSDKPFWWEYNNTYPLWTSAVKQNLKVAVYSWPGSQVCANAQYSFNFPVN